MPRNHFLAARVGVRSTRLEFLRPRPNGAEEEERNPEAWRMEMDNVSAPIPPTQSLNPCLRCVAGARLDASRPPFHNRNPRPMLRSQVSYTYERVTYAPYDVRTMCWCA
nr:uncharacterized protein CTRU02_12372 [Colletotrichum truncatum]KAF6784667.1 hypothetical protein CTRU02_12372 [Colletotrichum truncatum]